MNKNYPKEEALMDARIYLHNKYYSKRQRDDLIYRLKKTLNELEAMK